MSKEKKLSLIFLFANLLFLLFGLFLIKEGTFSRFDDWAISFAQKMLASNTDYQDFAKRKIVLVKIDEKFFDKMKVTTWTFHRGYYAQLLKKLKSYGVKNIVFDVYFGDIKVSSGSKIQAIYNKTLLYFNNELKRQLSGNVVLGVIPSQTGVVLPEKDFLKKQVFLGYVESHTNIDQINDGVIPFAKYKKQRILSLGIAAYLNRLYVSGKISKNFKVFIKPEKSFLGLDYSSPYLIIQTNPAKYSLKIPLVRDSQKSTYYIFTPFFVANFSNAYSLYDVLKEKIAFPESIFSDKTVFVGATDQALNDIKNSYLGLIPGVYFHINTFLSTLVHFYITYLPFAWIILVLFTLFVVSYIFVVWLKDEIKSIFVFVILSAVLMVLFYQFWMQGYILPVGSLIVILFFKLLLDIFHVLVINETKKEKIKNWFSKYVSSKVLEKKERSSGALAERKNIAIMFSDIASFTNISEKLQAQEVVTMLNIYFKKANKFLQKTGVQIDKYIGDAIMAFWDNKNFTDDIVEAVLNFQRSHPFIEQEVGKVLGKKIEIKTRIGLHFGEAILGDIGDENTKIDYTAIGDNINLGSRLEGINKYYFSRVMMSEAFYKKIRKPIDFAIRLVDKITVKGKTEPIKIYQLMLYFKDEITDELRHYIKRFEKALSYYFVGDFQEAKEIFLSLKRTDYGSKDKLIDLFLERIKYLQANPPKNWDGVWRFSTK